MAGVIAFVVAVSAAAADQVVVTVTAAALTVGCGGWLARDAWRAGKRPHG
ncbi:hypothetical protein ACFV9E_14950 [Streptomyces sp. NPDC059835]